MTEAGLEESLGRLSALKRFPVNSFALLAIAETVQELCPTDDDAAGLVREVLCNFDEWCGPLALRKSRAQIVERDKADERKRIQRSGCLEAIRQRDAHEAECAGYTVYVNADQQTVRVSFCHVGFGELYNGVCCRRGDELLGSDPGYCKRRQVEELESRSGWMTEDERWNRDVRRKRHRAE